MMDYYAFNWAVLIYVGLLPGLIGAFLAATWSWRRGAGPARICRAALIGFVVAFGLATAVVVQLLRHHPDGSYAA